MYQNVRVLVGVYILNPRCFVLCSNHTLQSFIRSESSQGTPHSFQVHALHFQNQFLSHSWSLCHWSHQGHVPSSVVICQPLPAEKWSFLDWSSIWAEIAWHNHLFGSGDQSQTATQSQLCSRACTMARSYRTLIPQRRCSCTVLHVNGDALYKS